MAHRQPTEFGAMLRRLRLARNLSQAQLANRAGVSPGYVGLIETGDRGERPSLDIVKRFGQAVEASVPEMEALLRVSGHLGPDEPLIPVGRPTLVQAIDTDKRLSKTQKQLLKALIRSWIGKE